MSRSLYESYDPATGRATEVTAEADGRIAYVHTQDTRPIVESAKAAASNFDPHAKGDNILVARIPINVFRHLQRIGITDDPVAYAAWLNDPDNAVFRTDDRSRL